MRLTAIFLGFLALIAQPAVAAERNSLASQLQNQLSALVTTNSADVGVAAIDLRTGEIVSVRGTTRYPMASTMKIAVAATYLSYVENGERSLDEAIAGRSAASLMRAMMVKSDNHATDLLIRNLGGPRTIQRWLDWHNVEGMRVDRNIAQLLRAKRNLYETVDSSTPLAMATFLQRLDKGELLKPWGRNYLVELMAQCQTGKNRMKSLLPAGTVAHKTGTLNGYSSDVGFVRLPDGRRVAIAIFARGGSNRPQAIAQTARAIYDGFIAVVGWPYNAASSLTR
ncbi:MAG: class A beta-lactamase-related serine hydrolase [Pseudomonadota bacterium]|nr:class A beta-lactamase-related serine hydrolase [Pseudomonadota bacterium]